MIKFFLSTVRSRGLLFLFIYFKESVFFDLRFSTDTSFRVTKVKQSESINHKDIDDGLLYVASFSSVLRKTLGYSLSHLISLNLSSSFQFIDLGCGKGKSLIFFGHYFKKYVNFPLLGIEYDSILVDIANANLCKVDSNLKSAVIHESATNFLSYTQSQTLIVYIYNSFQGQTLQHVVNLLSSVKVIVIYVDPVEAFRFDSIDCFKKLKSHRGKYNADSWAIYTNIIHDK